MNASFNIIYIIELTDWLIEAQRVCPPFWIMAGD